MVGYCEPNSLGGRLIAGQKVVEIFREELEVKAEVRSIKSMSAHGDYEDLLHFLSCQDPAKVKQLFLVHGEYEVQQHFANRLNNTGFKHVAIPRTNISRHCEKAFSADEAILQRSLLACALRLPRASQ